MRTGIKKTGTRFLLLILIMIGIAVSPAMNQRAQAAEKASIKLNKTSLILAEGKGSILSAKVTGAKKTVAWSSGNKSVATVSSKGKVTARGIGICYIYAKANGKTAKCKVTVYTEKIYKNDFYGTGAVIRYDAGSDEAYDYFEALNDTSSSTAWSIVSAGDQKFLGCSLSQVIRTRRGITLGASKSSVILAYGNGTESIVTAEDGVYHVASVMASRSAWDKAMFNNMKKAKTCLAYTYARGSNYSIRFYFNSSKKLIAVAYCKGYSSMRYVTSVEYY